jgi:hypothetical protein
LNGVTLTIRKFNARHFGIDDLVEAGTLERWFANQLEDYVLARVTQQRMEDGREDELSATLGEVPKKAC